MNAKNEMRKGIYSGIGVEILIRLNQCRVARYQQGGFIVDTTDLISSQTLAQAA